MIKPFQVSAACLVLCLSMYLPSSACGDTIKTDIVCRYRAESSGGVGMEVDISNTGNATAYDVSATVFLADWVQVYDDLGNNRPGEKIHFNSRYLNPQLMPGRYVAVIRVNFEEQGGSPHCAYHFFEIPYRLDKESSCRPALSLDLRSPVFNKKAFRSKEGSIRLLMENGSEGTIRPHVFSYFPDGFSALEPNRSYELSPGEKKIVTIPLSMGPLVRNESTYHVVVWYEQHGSHYSRHIRGKIRVEESPVYLRGYLFLGATVLIILLGVTCWRSRRGGSSAVPVIFAVSYLFKLI